MRSRNAYNLKGTWGGKGDPVVLGKALKPGLRPDKLPENFDDESIRSKA